MNNAAKPPLFRNPFRPGAGHTPPYLAGRTAEQDRLRTLLTAMEASVTDFLWSMEDIVLMADTNA